MAEDVGLWHRLLRSWTELYMTGQINKPTFDAMNEFIGREFPAASPGPPPLTVLSRLQAAIAQYDQPPLSQETR